MLRCGRILAVVLATLVACTPPREEVEEAEADSVEAALADSADTSEGRSAPALVLRERTPLALAVGGSHSVRGTAEVYAECRVLASGDRSQQYEVATTSGDFEGGAAALGLIVRGFSGPGVYDSAVTVTLVMPRAGGPPDVRAGGSGCVARVEDFLSGSFSCESTVDSVAGGVIPDTAPAIQALDQLELVGTGTWRCPTAQ